MVEGVKAHIRISLVIVGESYDSAQMVQQIKHIPLACQDLQMLHLWHQSTAEYTINTGIVQ